MIHAIVNILQLTIMNNDPLFQVEYGENNFSTHGGVVDEQAT